MLEQFSNTWNYGRKKLEHEHEKLLDKNIKAKEWY